MIFRSCLILTQLSGIFQNTLIRIIAVSLYLENTAMPINYYLMFYFRKILHIKEFIFYTKIKDFLFWSHNKALFSCPSLVKRWDEKLCANVTFPNYHMCQDQWKQRIELTLGNLHLIRFAFPGSFSFVLIQFNIEQVSQEDGKAFQMNKIKQASSMQKNTHSTNIVLKAIISYY